MKIVEINGTNYSSTGNIMLNIAKSARLDGFEVFTCCKRSKKSEQFKYDNQIYIGNRYERLLSEELAYFTGYQNYFNYFGTKKFIEQLKNIKPDLVHLHVIHDTYLNLGMLFDYLNTNNIPVVWTFHDCWAFTGKCAYFEACGCDKWLKGCHNCPQLKSYPASKVDKTKLLYKKKQEWFKSIKDMTIVTPSAWLSKYVKQSHLNNYNVKVINNGINLEIFRPKESNFREKYNIQDKYILLGVGYNWAPRKGIDDFIKLANELSSEYQIVLVGTDESIDSKLPNNIISIHRTYNQEELVDIYSAADLFVNPTREENYPTVNMESLACGTSIVTYNTGGSPEIIDETCGSVVSKGDYDALKKEIIRIKEEKPYTKEACLKRAKSFDMNAKYKEYIELYKEILK